MEILINQLEKRIGEKLIFQNVNIHLKKGTALALRGVNGSGKTTLLRILSGADKHFKGDYHLRMETTPKIGYVPQDVVLFEEFSVMDNLLIFGPWGRSGRQEKEIIFKYAELFDFKEILKKKVKTLSGGQKRLVNLMACFIGEPDIIFLDEAIVGMDEEKIGLIKAYLLKIREDKIMILTSHQDNFLKEVANVSARLINGKLEIDNGDV